MGVNVQQLVIGVCGIGAGLSEALAHFVAAGGTLPFALHITSAACLLVSSIFGVISAAEGKPLPPPT
jgi:hypothetical protein